MEYSQCKTNSHSLALSYGIENISSIIVGEKGSGANFTYETGINLDKAKKNMPNIDPLKLPATVDFTVALNSNEMLLVELKLDCDNPNNLNNSKKRENLRRKIKDSESLLRCTNISKVRSEKVFVFKPEYVDIARNTISRIFLNRSNEILVLSEDLLFTKYFV